MQNQQLPPGDQITMRGSFNLAYFIFSCHATCFTPFLRRRFGREAFGFYGVGAFVLLLLLYGNTGHSIGLVYIALWFAAVARHRACTASDARRGDIRHSRYDGDPWLARKLLPGLKSDWIAKALVEPLLCLAVGIAVSAWSEPVGLFFMAGLISMAAVSGIDWGTERVRVQQMRDAYIEQQHLARLFRDDVE